MPLPAIALDDTPAEVNFGFGAGPARKRVATRAITALAGIHTFFGFIREPSSGMSSPGSLKDASKVSGGLTKAGDLLVEKSIRGMRPKPARSGP